MNDSITNQSLSKRSAQAGFSLIEVLFAIAIGMAVLAGVYTLYNRVMNAARRSSTITELQTLRTSIEMYKNEKFRYPESLEELRASGFLKKGEKPQDGWGNPIVYRPTPDGKYPYELFSYGPEGKGGDKSQRIDIR